MLYFWKAGGSRMSNMTFPCVNTIQLGRNPFNSSPQCKKSSLRHHFRRNSWKLGSQKLLAEAHFWSASRLSFFPILYHSQGHIWAKMAHYGPPLTPKTWPKMDPYEQKMAKIGLRKISEPPTSYLARYSSSQSSLSCHWKAHLLPDILICTTFLNLIAFHDHLLNFWQVCKPKSILPPLQLLSPS